jgi:hypothetical protein
MPMWRNWQTRQTQNLVLATVCGFDPLHRQTGYQSGSAGSHEDDLAAVFRGRFRLGALIFGFFARGNFCV